MSDRSDAQLDRLLFQCEDALSKLDDDPVGRGALCDQMAVYWTEMQGAYAAQPEPPCDGKTADMQQIVTRSEFETTRKEHSDCIKNLAARIARYEAMMPLTAEASGERVATVAP